MGRREWTLTIVVAVVVVLCLIGLVYLAANSDGDARHITDW